ncbi:transcription factor FapR [Halanaerobaculum tunisiense]
MENLSKAQRQQELKKKLTANPFLVDQELADIFGVSVQTIRLDRKELGIPEVRKRTKSVARQAYSKVKSVQSGEIIGELIDIELNTSGLSIIETVAEMALEETKVVRGHHIFAQANSLAVSIIDTDTALTGSADIRYNRPVAIGERLVAKARVTDKKENKFHVVVETKIKEEKIFHGEFVVFAVADEVSGKEED